MADPRESTVDRPPVRKQQPPPGLLAWDRRRAKERDVAEATLFLGSACAARVTSGALFRTLGAQTLE
jgi:hypothetical protein